MTSRAVPLLPTRAARSVALVVTAVVALFGATACENPADRDAARVGGSDVTRDSLLDTADVYAAMTGDPYQLATDTEHSYSSSGLAAILGEQIVDQIVYQAADRYGLEPDPEVMSGIEQNLSSSSSDGASPFNDLPADRRQAFIEARALEQQLFQYVSANEWWNEDEAELFDSLVADGTIPAVQCLHHILVDTEDEANEVLAELDDGTSFEDLASRSTDTASAQAGGDLGCNPAGSFVPEFEAAIEDAAPGDVVGPVETEFGFHVIQVDTALEAPTIEQSGSNGWLEVLRRTTKVHVDPRYGVWDASIFGVTPPEGAATPVTDGLDLDL